MSQPREIYQSVAWHRTIEPLSADIRPMPSWGALFSLLLVISLLLQGCCSAATAGQAGYAPAETRAPVGSATQRPSAPGNTIRVPFQLVDNRIFVAVQLNGQGPFYFILDTGAHNVVDASVAQRLGLEASDHMKRGGAGAKRVRAYRTKVRSMDIGGAELGEQKLLAISLSEVRRGIGFRALDGVLGFELLKRFVVAIHYRQQQLDLVPSAHFKYDNTGRVVPFELYKHIPTVHGTVGKVAGRFWIDLGDRSQLTLNQKFSADHPMLHQAQPNLKATTGWGVGGPIRARVIEIPELTFAGVTFKNVVTRLPTTKGGAYTNKEISGSIGNGLLMSHDLIIDYPRRRLIFTGPGHQPIHYDRSGIWLMHRDGQLVVGDVVAGGPADEAGLHVGDRILQVNGHAAASVDVPALRQDLCRDDYTDLTLTVAGNDDQPDRTVRLKPRLLLGAK